jgi:hypothetical protein
MDPAGCPCPPSNPRAATRRKIVSGPTAPHPERQHLVRPPRVERGPSGTRPAFDSGTRLPSAPVTAGQNPAGRRTPLTLNPSQFSPFTSQFSPFTSQFSPFTSQSQPLYLTIPAPLPHSSAPLPHNPSPFTSQLDT